MPLSGEQREFLLRIARQAIRAALSGETPRPPTNHDATALHHPAACFVSLHEIASGRLRGCVGRLEARDALLLAVHESALSVLEDPRFADTRLTLLDLPSIEIELTILSPLRPTEHPLDFEPLMHGICLTLWGRNACFLPQVARQTQWNREQLLERLCMEKLGLPCDAWRDPAARLMVFDSEIIGPEPFETCMV